MPQETSAFISKCDSRGPSGGGGLLQCPREMVQKPGQDMGVHGMEMGLGILRVQH